VNALVVEQEEVLRLSRVSVLYGPRPALDDVSVSVKSGELVAVVGENGAGKSTLVGCVSGALAPDSGTVTVCGRDPAAALKAGELAVVWQDLALCDNLTVTANLFLGAEVGRVFLARRKMRHAVEEIVDRVGLDENLLNERIANLSGGERQSVAIARALMVKPRLLVLDEPTSALGVHESTRFERLIRSLCSDGVAVLLVSHRVEQVFGLADRVLALRQGRLAGIVSTVESHVDDIVALMSGLNVDSVARRHLARLSSLVDQLAEVEPSASLPMIVSAMSTAFGQPQMCIHLTSPDGEPTLRLGASVGIAAASLVNLDRLPFGKHGGCIGEAAATGLPVVADDLRSYPSSVLRAMSAWSVPIQGSSGVYGVLTGLADVPGRPQDDQLRLAAVYASLAATAIERERLLDDVTRRNRVLEALRGVSSAFAGPGELTDLLDSAVRALAGGLGAESVALHDITSPDSVALLTTHPSDAETPAGLSFEELTATAHAADTGARMISSRIGLVKFRAGDRRFAVTARWTARQSGGHGLDLLESAARSLRLAIERDISQAAQAETDALRRTGSLQREFIHRLSHELRTPLTAITGYASTLRATDVSWDPTSQRRFLDAIASQSARMGRLVDDLLDSSALASGVMSLHCDWCDLPTLLDVAIEAIDRGSTSVSVEINEAPSVWADHDRLEQVLVNLLDNSFRYGAIKVVLRAYCLGASVVIDVHDDGPGIPIELRSTAFDAYVRGSTSVPGAGLGLSICNGIIKAHNGELTIENIEPGSLVRVRLPFPAETVFES
jgi:ABC-type multidrug transport system ATPase subunit/signal transduction histidine kinase